MLEDKDGNPLEQFDMVILKNEIWDKASKGLHGIYLCPECIEKSLERKIQASDFHGSFNDGSKLQFNIDYAKRNGIIY
jgi:hypothetical protein